MKDHALHTESASSGAKPGDSDRPADDAAALREAADLLAPLVSGGERGPETLAAERVVSHVIHRFDCEWCDECAGPNFNQQRLAREVLAALRPLIDAEVRDGVQAARREAVALLRDVADTYEGEGPAAVRSAAMMLSLLNRTEPTP